MQAKILNFKSVNEHIGDSYASLIYPSFDNDLSMIQIFGKGSLIGTMDIKSAFRLLTCFPLKLGLLGIK